jgi:hypothetical protein
MISSLGRTDASRDLRNRDSRLDLGITRGRRCQLNHGSCSAHDMWAARFAVVRLTRWGVGHIFARRRRIEGTTGKKLAILLVTIGLKEFCSWHTQKRSLRANCICRDEVAVTDICPALGFAIPVPFGPWENTARLPGLPTIARLASLNRLKASIRN